MSPRSGEPGEEEEDTGAGQGPQLEPVQFHRTWSRRVGKAQVSPPGLFGCSPDMLHAFVFFFPLLIFPAVIICLTGRKDSH